MPTGNQGHTAGGTVQASPSSLGPPNVGPGVAYLRSARNQIASRPPASVVGMPKKILVGIWSSLITLKRARRKTAPSTQTAQAIISAAWNQPSDTPSRPGADGDVRNV